MLALLFVLSLPAVTPRIYASDEIEYYAFLRSLWFDHDLSFENEYRHFYDAGVARTPGFHETFLERLTPTGLRVNFATIGCAVLWTPFFAAGDLAARAMRAAGSDVSIDGYSSPYITAVCYGSACYAFLAIVLAMLVATDLTWGTAGLAPGRSGPLMAALLVWIGTPLAFYMYVAPPMSHATSAFTVAALVWAWLRVRPRWSAGGCALVGALAAMAGMVREQDLFFALGPALDLGWTLGSRLVNARRRSATSAPESARSLQLLVNALVGIAAFAVTYLPQAVAYLVLNGRVWPSPLVSRKMSWHAPHALEVLFSPEHGFLAWTPLAALAIAGLVVAAARRPAPDTGTTGTAASGPLATARIAACMLVMVAAQVYVAGSVESWTVAGAFGQRRFVATTVMLVVGLAVLADAWQRKAWRATLGAASILCVWWNLGLMVQFGAGLMDRQRLDLKRNAYTSFVELPRTLPGLARRYLFDRASFYQGTAGEPAPR